MRPCVSRKQTPYVRNCCLPLPPQTIIPFVVILPHNPAHVKSPKASASAQVTGLEARLSNPTCRGTRTVSPRNPFFCGNALLHFLVKTYIIIADNKKKAGRKGATNTRPALCRRIPLSHTADITAPVFHYTPFDPIYQGGECGCALVGGVGNL